MHWIEKMENAMKLMKEACKDRTDCGSCPFEKYCNLLEGEEYNSKMLPYNFFKFEKEE